MFDPWTTRVSIKYLHYVHKSLLFHLRVTWILCIKQSLFHSQTHMFHPSVTCIMFISFMSHSCFIHASLMSIRKSLVFHYCALCLLPVSHTCFNRAEICSNTYGSVEFTSSCTMSIPRWTSKGFSILRTPVQYCWVTFPVSTVVFITCNAAAWYFVTWWRKIQDISSTFRHCVYCFLFCCESVLEWKRHKSMHII